MSDTYTVNWSFDKTALRNGGSLKNVYLLIEINLKTSEVCQWNIIPMTNCSDCVYVVIMEHSTP